MHVKHMSQPCNQLKKVSEQDLCILTRGDIEEHTCLVSDAASEPVSVMMNDGTSLRQALLPWTRGSLQTKMLYQNTIQYAT